MTKIRIRKPKKSIQKFLSEKRYSSAPLVSMPILIVGTGHEKDEDEK